jgi:hypothetical protein
LNQIPLAAPTGWAFALCVSIVPNAAAAVRKSCRFVKVVIVPAWASAISGRHAVVNEPSAPTNAADTNQFDFIVVIPSLGFAVLMSGPTAAISTFPQNAAE